jgi:hypothetical protein
VACDPGFESSTVYPRGKVARTSGVHAGSHVRKGRPTDPKESPLLAAARSAAVLMAVVLTSACGTESPDALPSAGETSTGDAANAGADPTGTPADGSGDSTALPSLTPPAPTADEPAATRMMYGVTVDDPWRAAETAAAIAALPRPVITRVVFDEGMAAREYVTPVRTIAAAGPIMGEILDSFFVPGLTVAEYRARAREYVSTLGPEVAIWEIGNEVNGEWLGDTPTVVSKIRAAHEEVKAAKGRTALTLYYNQDCWADRRNEMFTWVEANLSAELRADLDYVWVSFYEDDCNGIQPDWKAVFDRLGPLFPNSQLGFGECGTNRADKKVEYLRRWYTTRPDSPRFVGGYFWWYFSTDMVPQTLPLWSELASVLAAAP